MRWKQLVELIKVNLLYANPQMLNRDRNAKPSTFSGPAKITIQNIMLLVFFTFLYGFLFAVVDFTLYPGLFTIYVLSFVVMAMLQGFYIIFNLLYESKDLVFYLPLPFKSSEVFVAKLTAIVFSLLPYLSPIFSLFFLLGRSAGYPFFRNVLQSLFLFLLLSMIVLLVSIILVYFLSQLSVFQTYQKIITTGIYAISTLALVLIIVFVGEVSDFNITTQHAGQSIPDYQTIPFLVSFHQIILSPFTGASLLKVVLWLVVLMALLGFVLRFVIPSVYEHATKNQVTTKKRTTLQQPKSLTKTLIKYNFGLIQDGTLIMQYVSSNIMFPIILIGPLLTGDSLSLHGLEAGKWWGLAFLIGFLYAFLTLNAISIVGVIISLDRENFTFIQSWPLSMRHYLKTKFWFTFGMQVALPIIITGVLLVLLKTPILLILCFFPGLILGIYFLCEYYFARDYRLLVLDWQNLTELFARGGGNFAQVVRLFGLFFVGALAILAIGFLLLNVSPLIGLMVSILLVMVPVGITIHRKNHSQQHFWSNFD